ncbi:dihydroorotase [Albibacterium indicum]|uniref:dihydroorotase n=1 Tax=Albibacterium indicum TaxID=2292082 RepID=UPI000E4B0389|nr:dihydroorotase [Pedobacter indicus]
MEKLIVKNATILFSNSTFYKKQADVLIENGIIKKIEKPGKITVKNINVINARDRFLAPGFFDLNCNFGEPGYETKEDLITGAAAAAAGGFTELALQPNTNPPLHSRSEVAFIVNSTRDLIVNVYPVAAVSKNREGGELAELYDMRLAGAVAFSDGNRSIQHSGLMSRALLYSKGFGGLVFSYAEDKSIAGNTKMNEGEMSTYLGMKGNPNMAEEVMISRDLFLAEYNDTPIHFSTITCAGSVDLIRRAKKKGLRVTCDVAAHHLLFTDEEVSSFDSNYKVKPPLRTKKDRSELIKGVKDGTIDAIVSQHTPHEVEFKTVEFEIAEFGITGLQTLLPILLKVGLSLEMIVEKLAVNPRKILNLPEPTLEVNASANLILINPDELWIFDQHTNRSKATNNPLFNSKLKGKVDLLVNKGHTLNLS